MRVEVDALIAHHTWAEPGDLRDLLLTDVSVTCSPELARLYGVDVWDGSAAHPRFAPGERPGLLTRAAFLVNGEHQTNPIHRGAVLRQRILCDTLALPDPADLPEGALDPPEFTPEMSTRERWEEKTANEPCASCHASINPLGFVLERYDALGRFRVTEEILDGRTGEPVAEHSIDTRATVSVGGVVVELDEPRALMELVADNGKTESCFARQYFRYTHARRETAADGCALESVRSSLVGSESVGTLREALRAIALSPSFKSRVVGEE
jgi:hypothetical protein